MENLRGMKAIAEPVPEMSRNHKPTFPALVWTCGQMATAEAYVPMPEDKNISNSTQP